MNGKSGIMEHGRIKSKKLIVILFLFIVLSFIGGILFVLLNDNDEVSFDSNDKLFFKMFVNQFEPEEYEFYSLDAYYLSDTNMFYYNAKYKCYSSIDDTWYDIDEVTYGRIDKFYNSYCLSWDDLYGYEEVDKEYRRALKEGVHKTYTEEEIKVFIESAYQEKNNE